MQTKEITNDKSLENVREVTVNNNYTYNHSTTSTFIVCATVFLILFLGDESFMSIIKDLLKAYIRHM